MAIEGLDAALPIETATFVPQAELPRAADGELTLDAALARAGREAIRESAAPDLWITDSMRSAVRPAEHPAALSETPAGGLEEAPADTDAPAEHPIVKQKLSLAEMGHMLRNRQYDSTDYGWEEMSSGDWEWAAENFKDDVYAGVEQATAGATSQAQADQLAQAYLNSIGLGSIVHVNGSVTGSNGEIVITAPQDVYHPTSYMPILSLDQPGFDSFDPRMVYDILDVSAITISFDLHAPLTPQQLEAVEILRLQIAKTTIMLNSLPANGVFVFADGRTITVAELRALWARADFVITDKDYSALGTAARPGAGAAHRNNGDPIFEVNVERLTNVFMPMDWTRTFYPLHELAHVTLAGYATTVAMWADGDASDPERDLNEAFATSLGIAIGQAAGYSWLPLFLSDGPPGEALPLVPLPIFTVPTSGDGGGTGGPGGGGGNVGEQ